MKKLALFLLLIPSVALGQSVRYQSQVTGPRGPIAGALVAVCTQPANTTTTPCSPLAILATSTSTTSGGANPTVTDQNGNFFFYAAPGHYTVQIYSPQITSPFVQPDTVLACDPAGTCSSSGTANFTGLLQCKNFETIRCVDGVNYTSVATAISDLLASSSNGGNVYIFSGYRETFTSTINVGTATKPVKVHLFPDVAITCNVAGNTPCWNLHAASGIEGVNVGSIGSGPRTGGATLSVASTAVASALIDTTDGTLSGGMSYITLRNLFLDGGGTITTPLSDSVVHINAVNNQPVVENLFILNFANTIGLHVTSNTTSGAVMGPSSFFNVWVNPSYLTGARPCVFEALSGTNTLTAIDVIGGTCQHPGSGLAAMEINGHGISVGGSSGFRIHTYLENLQNGSSIMLKIVDAVNVDFGGTVCRMRDTDTCVDISESGAGKAGAIHGAPLNQNSPTNAGTLINNHISGLVMTGSLSPFYNFGGEAAASAAATTIDTNNLMVGSSNNAAAKVHISGSSALVNPLELDDTEVSGKNITFGPGVFTVGRASLFDKTDNKELFACNLLTTGGCMVLGGLTPFTAASGDLGSTSLPFGNLWLGTAGTNNFKFQPAATAAARTVSVPDPGTNVNLAFNLSATSAAFATATTAGTCVQNTTAVAGAATTMVATASPVSTPGVGAQWSAFVSSAGNVTINECAVAASAGGTIAFNIRVQP